MEKLKCTLDTCAHKWYNFFWGTPPPFFSCDNWWQIFPHFVEMAAVSSCSHPSLHSFLFPHILIRAHLLTHTQISDKHIKKNGVMRSWSEGKQWPPALHDTSAVCGTECENVCVKLPDSLLWWYSWCHYWLGSSWGVLFGGLAMCWCHVANPQLVCVRALLPPYLCGGLLPSSLGSAWEPVICVLWSPTHPGPQC